MLIKTARIATIVLLTISTSVGITSAQNSTTTNREGQVLSAEVESTHSAQIAAQEIVVNKVENPIAGESGMLLPDTTQITSTNSASLAIDGSSEETRQKIKQDRIIVLQRYLKKHNSPLVDNAQDFVEAAEQYNLDWRLVVSIAGVESTFGKRTYSDSHNPFGWGGGYIMFPSWRDAIYTVSKGLSEKYVQKGLKTPIEMQAKYAPPSHTWGRNVNFFMDKIEQESLASN